MKMHSANRMMLLEVAQRRLALIWCIGLVPSWFIVILQSIFGRFGDKVTEAFGWLTPITIPNLMLIVTVLGYSYRKKLDKKTILRVFYYRLTASVAIVYLLAVLATILAGPFAAADGAGMLRIMHMSSLWLGTSQGVVATCYGVMFVRKQLPHEPDQAAQAALDRATGTLSDLARRVAALPADPTAIAQLAADIQANNDAIRAESAEVVAEFDKVAPSSTAAPGDAGDPGLIAPIPAAANRSRLPVTGASGRK